MASGLALSGNIEFLNLGDILQLLGSNGSTGLLRLKSKYAQETGDIYIVKGNPIDATNGAMSGLKAIESLFGWTIGQFEFEEKNIKRDTTIKKGRMNIVLDCLSMLDEGDIPILGPVSYSPDESGKEASIPTIKGPLVDYMYVVDEEEFQDGQDITVEGKHGNWIWVVLEGTVEISKKSSEGEVKVLRVTDGAFIGSTASFSMGGNVRSTTARASGHVQLGILDSQRLASEFAAMTTPFRGVVTSLDRRLRELTEKMVNSQLQDNLAAELMEGRESILKQGDSEEGIFSIKQGEASVIRQTKHGELPIASLSSGDVYGRIPFLDIGHEPESASVYGSEDLETETLDTDALVKEYEDLSTTFKNFLENLATCISVTTRMANANQKKKAEQKKKTPAKEKKS